MQEWILDLKISILLENYQTWYGPVLESDMQTPTHPFPPKVAKLSFWSKKMFNVLKRMQKKNSDFSSDFFSRRNKRNVSSTYLLWSPGLKCTAKSCYHFVSKWHEKIFANVWEMHPPIRQLSSCVYSYTLFHTKKMNYFHCNYLAS